MVALLNALKGNWAAVVLIAVFVAAIVATILFAPPETQAGLFGGEGIIATLVGIWLRSPKDRTSISPTSSSDPPKTE